MLKNAGVTHMLLRYDLIDSWINNNLGQEQRELLKLFFQKRVNKIKSNGGYGLFELIPASSKSLVEATP